MSKIEWTDATWNPLVGCAVTSPGCTNCYAMAMAGRLEAMNEATGKTPHYAGLTRKVNGKTVWTGKVGQAPDAVWEQPLRRRKPTTYFVNSMGDLFHPEVTDDQIDRVFAIMALAPQHRFQVLTKHPERMRDWMIADPFSRILNVRVQGISVFDQIAKGRKLSFQEWPLPNVWLGVSVEDQRRADERIPLLLDTPAAVRFVSCEPLLGPVNLTLIQKAGTGTEDAPVQGDYWLSAIHGGACVFDPDPGQDPDEGWVHIFDAHPKLDWVIVGGESGPDARPMHPDWARSIRDQCADADVPFFFKQWGEYFPHGMTWKEGGDYSSAYIREAPVSLPSGTMVYRVGKSKAGRLLDGVVHDAMPAAEAQS